MHWIKIEVVILVIEFLELTKSLFSTFDLVRERSLEFKLNQDKFESSDAKNKMKDLLLV
jgi:hypothetical protein